MNVTSRPSGYNPVTITLETEKEFHQMWNLLQFIKEQELLGSETRALSRALLEELKQIAQAKGKQP